MRYLGLVLLLVLTTCKNVPTEAPSEDTSSKAPTQHLLGVDVSQYQGTVDFEKVKAAGVSFAYIKATQGNTWQSPDYKADFEAARAAGLIVGFYHYYMTDDAPQTQFDNFTSHVDLGEGDLPPVVDIEALHKNTRPDLADDLRQFLSMLEGKYGVKPIIYSGVNFANEYLSGFGNHPLWLAEYGVDQPKTPSGWESWAFWQYSQSGTVDGVNGPVDLDRFSGTHQQLQALLIP